MQVSKSSGRKYRKLAAFGAFSTAAIMTQPHLALGLPGHRALAWLALIVAMRLMGGAGWSTGLGIAAAVGTLAIGRSPNGIPGVLQYVAAGALVDVALWMKPSLAGKGRSLAVLGALTLVTVGWITPISQTISGGADFTGVWMSLRDVSAAAWLRLLSYDFAFGASAGAIGWAIVSLRFSRTPAGITWKRPQEVGVSS